MMRGFAAVAQLDRVLGYEPRGRGFNSCQPHQNFGSRTQLGNASFRAVLLCGPASPGMACLRREMRCFLAEPSWRTCAAGERSLAEEPKSFEDTRPQPPGCPRLHSRNAMWISSA